MKISRVVNKSGERDFLNVARNIYKNDKVWVSDTTFIATRESYLYLAVII